MIKPADIQSFDQRFSLVRTLKREHLVSEEQQTDLTIMDAQKGCFFRLFEDTYYVLERNLYQEMSKDFTRPTNETVTKLTCICLETGHQGHFEWQFNDNLEIHITLDQTNFKRLTTEEGQPIDEDDLGQIVADRGNILYAGEIFRYSDDWAGVYKQEDRNERVYLFEFVNAPGTLTVTIEEWIGPHKDEYRIYIAKKVIPEDITILSLKAPKQPETAPGAVPDTSKKPPKPIV